jgi:DEAD/DEAH box helicase domain-containing protein
MIPVDMRKITFDIETANDFSDTGSGDPASLELAMVCIHDSADNSYRSFVKEELKDLWSILEHADLLIGFNIEHFDIPILAKYYAGNLAHIRTVDLLKEVRNSLGRRLKLQTIAEATLGAGKLGSGIDSLRWWREGKLDKVREYCIEDVRITKALYDHARTHGFLKFRDRGALKDIPLPQSKNWEAVPASSPSLTHTLPF